MRVSLKAARVNSGLTQEQVAKRMNVDVSTIAKWEKGRTSPTAERFSRLCEIYGASIDEIFLPQKLG